MTAELRSASNDEIPNDEIPRMTAELRSAWNGPRVQVRSSDHRHASCEESRMTKYPVTKTDDECRLGHRLQPSRTRNAEKRTGEQRTGNGRMCRSPLVLSRSALFVVAPNSRGRTQDTPTNEERPRISTTSSRKRGSKSRRAVGRRGSPSATHRRPLTMTFTTFVTGPQTDS